MRVEVGGDPTRLGSDADIGCPPLPGAWSRPHSGRMGGGSNVIVVDPKILLLTLPHYPGVDAFSRSGPKYRSVHKVQCWRPMGSKKSQRRKSQPSLLHWRVVQVAYRTHPECSVLRRSQDSDHVPNRRRASIRENCVHAMEFQWMPPGTSLAFTRNCSPHRIST